jgi:hypothetical protein
MFCFCCSIEAVIAAFVKGRLVNGGTFQAGLGYVIGVGFSLQRLLAATLAGLAVGVALRLPDLRAVAALSGASRIKTPVLLRPVAAGRAADWRLKKRAK